MKTITRLALFTSLVAHGMFAAESPRLIPFQGRLTDQQGNAYSNGQFTVLFQLYDGPVGGTPSWSERHEKVGVMNGMVNIFLGSISSLANQSFSETRHLGITIDADNNPNTPDPEMVPRQMIIPAFWAKQSENSAKLNGYDWSVILASGTNPATGTIPGGKLQPQTITATQIAPSTITASQIAANAVTSNQIAVGQINASHLSASFAVDALIPPGTIQAFGGTNIPAGWLHCDGRAFPVSQFPRLYAAIGNAWGGSAPNFNLPDLRGLFLRGVDFSFATGQISGQDPGATQRAPIKLGGNAGNNVGSFQGDLFAAHSHDYYSAAASLQNSLYPNADGRVLTLMGDRNSTWSKGRYDFGIEATGGNETRPRNAYVHYIIKY